MPELSTTYLDGAASLFKSAPDDVASDLLAQLAKVAKGLLTARYSTAADGDDEPAVVVQPRMFKRLVGKGHAEFASARQQDAQEYFQHLLSVLQRAERGGGGRLADGAPRAAGLFDFKMEERVEADGMVSYSTTPAQSLLSLNIPKEMAANAAEVAAYEER